MDVQVTQAETLRASGSWTALSLLKLPSMNQSVSDASLETPQPVTLLIVETDAVFLEFEAQSLTNRGYTVLKASGRAEALRLAVRSGTVHLLLTECPQLTQQFRTIYPTAPVLLIGALEAFDETVQKLGRVGVMAKPFTLEELITKVHRLLTETAPLPYRRSEAAKAHADCQYLQMNGMPVGDGPQLAKAGLRISGQSLVPPAELMQDTPFLPAGAAAGWMKERMKDKSYTSRTSTEATMDSDS
jgi:CheY-like chemotaxis protein